MPNRKAPSGGPRSAANLVFVDANGGALAALAAGVARSLGRAGARALTTSAAVKVPREIDTVLDEIGASAPPVERAADRADGADAVERVDLGSWGLVLFEGDGEPERLALERLAPERLAPERLALERLALARIARDRIARRLEPSG